MQPTNAEWRALYEAAITFRDAAPWQWMDDTQVFGVQDPESAQIGYCCIMGELGEHFALAAYRGSEGLDGLWRMRTAWDTGIRDPMEILSLQDCLMASFEDRGQLHRRDLDQIRALGLKFRGRNAWPLFRSYRPGYEPWFLTAPEARFLTLCLAQALGVAERVRQNPRLLPQPAPRAPMLVRVPERRGDEWDWNDTLQRPAPAPRPEAVPLPLLDEARLRRLRELPASRGVLELDYFYTNTAIKGENDERPYFPHLVLGVDAASGMPLGFKLASPSQVPALLVEVLLEVMEGMGMRPARIRIQREEAAAVLKPVTDRLRIRLGRARRLPAVEAARGELAAFLMR
jgi:hypothetical protein